MHLRRWGRNVWPFLLVALVIAVRNPVPICRPEFWAEDADQLFITAMNRGVESILLPIYGYHFLIPRLIAYLAGFFPIIIIPLLYTLSSLAFNALATGYFSRDGFSWLIPRRSFRVFICATLAIGPGTAEVFLNLINLASPLAFLAALILLEEPRHLSNRKLLALVILALSSGQTFLFLPLVIYLWNLTGNRRYALILAVISSLALINFIGSTGASREAGLLNYEHGVAAPRIMLEQGFVRLLSAPLLGPNITGRLMKAPDYIFWPLLFASLSLILWACSSRWNRAPDRVALLTLTYAGAIAAFGIIAVARNYAIGLIQRQGGTALWDMRYSYLPGQVVMVIWFAWLYFIKERVPRMRHLVTVVFAVLLSWNLSQWHEVYERPDLHWPETAKKLEQALRAQEQGALREAVAVTGFKVHPSWYHLADMPLVVEINGRVTVRAEKSYGKR